MSCLMFRNRHLLWMTVLIILIGGTSALLNLPRQEDPRLTNRFPLVLTTWPGASAERIEALVSEPLETAIRQIAEVATIEATSRPGVSSLSIELAESIGDAEQIFSRLRDKVENVPLPAGASMQFEDEREPVAYSYVLALTWQPDEPPPLDFMARTSKELAHRLRRLAGSEQILVFAAPEEEIRIDLRDSQLAALNITLPEVADALAGADSKVSAGTLVTTGQRLPVEVAGGFTAIERIGQVPLAVDAGRVLTVADVGTVTRTWKTPVSTLGLHNGKRAIFIAARLENGFQIDHWMPLAQAVVEQFKHEQGSLLAVDTVFDQRDYTRERLLGLGNNLIAGVLIIVAVIAVLMGLRAALVVGLALPLTVGSLLMGLSALGVPLHQMSLFGTIIALGLLIDNAIVMVDEVRKRMLRGQTPAAAITSAVQHLRGPLTSSTLTTVLSFMPIALLPGPAGEFVGTIAVAVITALLSSLLLALFVLPALTAIIAPARAYAGDASDSTSARWWQDGVSVGWFQRGCEKLLVGAVSNPLLSLSVIVLLSGIGFARAGELGQQFFPAADRDMFQVRIWMPAGTTIAETQRTMQQADTLIAEHPGVLRRSWHAGGSFPSVYYNQIMDTDGSPDYAQGVITATSGDAAKALVGPLQQQLDDALPGGQVVVTPFAQGPPVSAPVMFRIVGPDGNRLRALGDELRALLAQIPGVTHTQANMQGGQPKLWLDVDENEASERGWSLRSVATQIQMHLDGTQAGSQLESTEEIPVRVVLAADRRRAPDDLTDTYFTVPGQDGTRGELLHLGAISSLTLQPELASIFRRNGERTNVVSAYLVPAALPPDITAQALAFFTDQGLQLPPGYRLEVGGDSEESAQASGNLATFAPVLLLLMATSIILGFRSVTMALMIGGVALCSIGFGLLALRVSGYPFGFNPLLGLAGLIGLAINDSIVVLAAIRDDAAARAGNVTALVRASLSCGRHVLATTATTIGGFLPLLIAGGDFWPPLAVIIAGGVAGATLLALVAVPCAYRFTCLLQTWSRNWRQDAHSSAEKTIN